jgi:hypothetical protein
MEKYCGFDGYVLAKAAKAERRNAGGGERLARGIYAWMWDLGFPMFLISFQFTTCP